MSDDRPKPHAPEQDQSATPEMDTDWDAAPAAQQPDGEARIAEAGNAYTGRGMKDELKSSPRVEDGEAATDEDPTTPERE